MGAIGSLEPRFDQIVGLLALRSSSASSSPGWSAIERAAFVDSAISMVDGEPAFIDKAIDKVDGDLAFIDSAIDRVLGDPAFIDCAVDKIGGDSAVFDYVIDGQPPVGSTRLSV